MLRACAIIPGILFGADVMIGADDALTVQAEAGRKFNRTSHLQARSQSPIAIEFWEE